MAPPNRSVFATTPLGPDQLVFYNMTGTEEIGRLFEFEVELLRDQKLGSVDSDKLLGQGLTVTLDLADGSNTRYFNGEIVQFKHTGLRNRYSCYSATLRPWLWYLSLNANCRIFQDKSVADIIKAVLGEYSFADVEYNLEGEYQPLDYCVQYRESDFNFISRLMEHDGIFYYFKHRQGKHSLVITDSNNTWQTVSGYQTIPYVPAGNSESRERDHIHEWLHVNQMTAGKFEQNDFDLEVPSADLTTKKHKPGKYQHSGQEVYDFPGEYTDSSVGTKLTDKRLEERQMAYSLKHGQGNAAGLIPGMRFSLEDHYFSDEDGEHIIVSASYVVQGDDIASGMGAPGEIFQCCFSAIDVKQAYRPSRITPKPVISGSQTAIVVGKSGEEIWTDKYGRVKVQFHWDREGQSNEDSSCWVRASQPMAGNKWGWISLPRIGQEVIVSFMEGDPDRPMITGSVHNDEQMPPYELPANKTLSSLKSNSSKGGGGFNELRFEDKKGEEQIFFHAEKNQDIRVKNDHFEFVGNERHLIVEGDQLEQVGGDKHLTLNGDKNEKIDGTVSRDIGGDLQEKIGSNHGLEAGSEIHLKAGMKVVIEAGVGITLKVGGSFVVVDSSGVSLTGPIVKINSGGAAGSGSGCSPDAAKAPLEADTAIPGEISKVPSPKTYEKTPPTPQFSNPQAQTLATAAENGTPFCEKCEAAKKAAAAQSA